MDENRHSTELCQFTPSLLITLTLTRVEANYLQLIAGLRKIRWHFSPELKQQYFREAVTNEGSFEYLPVLGVSRRCLARCILRIIHLSRISSSTSSMTKLSRKSVCDRKKERTCSALGSKQAPFFSVIYVSLNVSLSINKFYISSWK
jgi:hypothetical protein